MSINPARRVRNRLLQRLQSQDYERLFPHLRTVSLQINHVLVEARSPIEFIHFPLDCVLSAIAMTSDGEGIEAGTIGNEGVEGLTAFLGPCISPNRVIAQIPGDAVRVEAAILAGQAKNAPALHELLLRHHQAFLAQVTQSVACNGLHTLVKRCCRWLLMTHDRLDGDELPLTHEFLSLMLAVRRPGVTEALQMLQDRGLIMTSRGVITIKDRAGLEAACCDCYQIVASEYERLLGSG